MRLLVLPSLDAVSPASWDALTGDHHPFVEHAFLHGLEQTGCVGPGTGWQPVYLVIVRDPVLPAGTALPPGAILEGAVPAWLKTDSLGEFIFDWGWAELYERYAVAYYPKLVVAVPFTPATGPRLLLRPGPDAERVAGLLADAVRDLARAAGASSAHWLFTDAAQTRLLQQHGYFRRDTLQARWLNPGYRDFDAFLATRASRFRKQIRRERREVCDAGLHIALRTGADLGDEEWAALHRFYLANAARHGSEPYLKPAFFQHLRRALAHRVVATLARGRDGYVAGTLNFVKGDTLYGRYWGCTEEHPFLHFELAFYRLMDHCIAAGLRRFEAGAGGEHKLKRGMEISVVHSAHWLADARLGQAIERHVAQERRLVAEAIAGPARDATRRRDEPGSLTD